MSRTEEVARTAGMREALKDRYGYRLKEELWKD